MNINDILKEKGMTKYRLATLSGVPHTTLNNICSGQARIEKCSAETLYKIAKVLNVTIEDLIEEAMVETVSFELFKSNVCHRVKDAGDVQFIVETLEANDIGRYYRLKKYAEAFYLLAMLDYLSRENEIPLCNEYDYIRRGKLAEPLFPDGVIALANATGDESVKQKYYEEAIPEFKQFNIIENEVRNVI